MQTEVTTDVDEFYNFLKETTIRLSRIYAEEYMNHAFELADSDDERLWILHRCLYMNLDRHLVSEGQMTQEEVEAAAVQAEKEIPHPDGDFMGMDC